MTIVTSTCRYKRSAQIPLKVAAHEVGHAVTQLAVDEWPGVLPGPSIDSIEVTSPLTGIVSVQPRLFASGLSVTPRNLRTRWAAELDIITTFAGPVAEARCQAGSLGVLGGIDQWMAVLQEQAPGHPMLDQWRALGREVQDHDQILWRLAWMQPADMLAEAKRLALIAAWVVEVEWPGILRMSRALREERQMTGEAFEEAWRTLRPGEVVRRRRERRASEHCGFVAPGSGP